MRKNLEELQEPRAQPDGPHSLRFCASLRSRSQFLLGTLLVSDLGPLLVAPGAAPVLLFPNDVRLEASQLLLSLDIWSLLRRPHTEARPYCATVCGKRHASPPPAPPSRRSNRLPACETRAVRPNPRGRHDAACPGRCFSPLRSLLLFFFFLPSTSRPMGRLGSAMEQVRRRSVSHRRHLWLSSERDVSRQAPLFHKAPSEPPATAQRPFCTLPGKICSGAFWLGLSTGGKEAPLLEEGGACGGANLLQHSCFHFFFLNDNYRDPRRRRRMKQKRLHRVDFGFNVAIFFIYLLFPTAVMTVRVSRRG